MSRERKLADFFSLRIKGIILADGWNARQPQVAGNVRQQNISSTRTAYLRVQFG